MHMQMGATHTAAESLLLGAEHLLTDLARFPREAVHHSRRTVQLHPRSPAMLTHLPLRARPPPFGADIHRRLAHVR
jgi:hypothetical protein